MNTQRRYGSVLVSYERLHSLLQLPPDVQIIRVTQGEKTAFDFMVMITHPGFSYIDPFCSPYCLGWFAGDSVNDWIEEPLLGLMKKEGE